MRARSVLAWPYIAGLTLSVGLPAVGAVALAWTDFSGVEAPRFTGLANLLELGGDRAFWLALGNSLVLVTISVPLRLAAALAFALLLHRRGPATSGARAIVLLPTVVPDVAYALLWLWLLNPLYGPLQAVLPAFRGVLTDPWGARVALAVMGAFQIGEAFVIALAARSVIPRQLYEAAAVDGARPWFVLRRVTLPMMGPVLALLALRDVVLTFQTSFVPALVITDGGPRQATTYLSLFLYRTAFRYFRLGYASAASLAMFAITAAAVFVQWRLARRWRPSARGVRRSEKVAFPLRGSAAPPPYPPA